MSDVRICTCGQLLEGTSIDCPECLGSSSEMSMEWDVSTSNPESAGSTLIHFIYSSDEDEEEEENDKEETQQKDCEVVDTLTVSKNQPKMNSTQPMTRTTSYEYLPNALCEYCNESKVIKCEGCGDYCCAHCTRLIDSKVGVVCKICQVQEMVVQPCPCFVKNCIIL